MERLSMWWTYELYNMQLSDWLSLTHLPLDKMADISQTSLTNAFSWMKISIFIKIPLKLVHEGQIDNNPSLV